MDGEDGVDGEQGPPGATGAAGATGAIGATGTTGNTGPQGVPGTDGEDGDPGPQGPPGPPPAMPVHFPGTIDAATALGNVERVCYQAFNATKVYVRFKTAPIYTGTSTVVVKVYNAADSLQTTTTITLASTTKTYTKSVSLTLAQFDYFTVDVTYGTVTTKGTDLSVALVP